MRTKRAAHHPEKKSISQCVSAGARLPPELCDIVIDHLHDDKLSLAACCLVCHSWLRAARYHLFDSIYVHCEKDAEAFNKFLEYLRSTPSIRAYIKDVCFDGFRDAKLDSDEAEDTLESTYLSAVTALLPQVHTYSFINCQWGRAKDEEQRWALMPVRLRSLYINSFTAASENTRNKLHLLRHFSHIGHLHLANLWLGHFGFDDDDDDEIGHCGDMASPLYETRVKSMSISMANICLNFLEYLRMQPFMRHLQSFRVVDLFHAEYLEEHQDLTFVGELLRDCLSRTLQEFHLELPRLPEDESADIYTELHLSPCLALTNIILRMPMRREIDAVDAETARNRENADADGEQPATAGSATQVESAPPKPTLFTIEEWRALLVILSQLPASTKTVSLDIELEGTNDAVYAHLRAQPNWQQLDSILAKLPALERVAIRRVKEDHPYIAHWTKAQHDLIIRKLPSLREKKVLSLQYWNSSVP